MTKTYTIGFSDFSILKITIINMEKIQLSLRLIKLCETLKLSVISVYPIMIKEIVSLYYQHCLRAYAQ